METTVEEIQSYAMSYFIVKPDDVAEMFIARASACPVAFTSVECVTDTEGTERKDPRVPWWPPNDNPEGVIRALQSSQT